MQHQPSVLTVMSHLTNKYCSRTTAFAATGGRQRLITTAILLLLITTLIPYQFAYMVLTIVQLCTCVRALRLARDTRSGAHYNFYNYTTSMLVLMLWVLPINMPVLIVWIHNLAVQWLTPFSTHHNLLAVLPLVLVVEIMSTGKMTPRVTGQARFITNVLTFLSALYAAIYGVTYACRLHHLLNILAAWLFAVHISSQPNSTSLGRLANNAASTSSNLLSEDATGRDVKKRP
jgi:glycosylphosphatidylinositol deacylase